MLRGHDLGALVCRHHLAVGHDHLGVWHGSEPLHGDHSVGHPVQGHDRDSTGRGHWDQAGRIMDVTLREGRERKKVS